VRHTFDKMASQLGGDIPTPDRATPTIDGATPTHGLTTPTFKRGLKNDDQTTDKDGGSQSDERDDGYDSEATEPAPKRLPTIKKQRLENKKAQKNATARPTLAENYRSGGEPADDPMCNWVELRKPVGVFPGLTKSQWMGMADDAKAASRELYDLYRAMQAALRSEAEVHARSYEAVIEHADKHELAEAKKLATLHAKAAVCLYRACEANYFECGGVPFKSEF
jgi:hypothetical protein